MSTQSGYKKQQRLSFLEFLTEFPGFITMLISAIVSKSLLCVVDLFDGLGCVLRTAMITLLSRKLSKDLRYEYNYGVGKIEAISSLLCNAIVFCGLSITVGLSIYSIISPSRPSDLLIAVVGIKAINVSFDMFFFVKQHRIIKVHNTAIVKTNYAASIANLIFDSVTLVSLLTIWLLRDSQVGLYISPIISGIVAIYLIIGCFKRIKTSLDELTDKTLPEEMQMKILNILNRFFNSYSQLYSVNSHKSGNLVQIDLHLSFDSNTTVEQIIELKKQMQAEFDKQIDNSSVNIILRED